MGEKNQKETSHAKKMVAPIVITIIICAYYIFFVALCFFIPMPLLVKILLGIIPLALAGVCIYVMIERINEIKGGEEDDLSKY